MNSGAEARKRSRRWTRFTSINRFRDKFFKIVTKKRSTYQHMRACQPTPVWTLGVERKRVHLLSERRRFPLLEATWKVQEFDSMAQKTTTTECNVVANEEIQIARCVSCPDEIRPLYIVDEHLFHNLCFTRSCILHTFSFFVTLCFLL